jgi:hypothetical protein
MRKETRSSGYCTTFAIIFSDHDNGAQRNASMSLLDAYFMRWLEGEDFEALELEVLGR